jgi:hypothetical protein
MNVRQLLRHVPDRFSGRVLEPTPRSVTTIPMLLAGVALQYWDPRTIGTIAGGLSSGAALVWGGMKLAGRLPAPALEGVGAGRDRDSRRADG